MAFVGSSDERLYVQDSFELRLRKPVVRAVEREDAPGVWVRIPGTVSGTPEQLGETMRWLETSSNKRVRLVAVEAADVEEGKS